MKKKYMIRCDIEGVSGVVSYEQAEPGKPEYALGQAMLISDLLAALEGLAAGGAGQVVIYDEHYYGRNIDPARLPDFATAICGKPPYRCDWAGGLDESFAGLILLGFHSKAGTPGGLLPHSYELDIADLRLNGVSVGEIGMEAAVAGDFNVPTLLIVGDSMGVREAEALMPGIAHVTVKEAISETGALCYPIAVTARAIKKAATKIVKSPPPVEPYRPGPNVTLEVQFHDGPYFKALKALHGRWISNKKTLTVEGKRATEVWATYWRMKLAAQARMRERSKIQP